MQNDILKIRIAVMAVRAPAARAQIHFHVPGTRRVVTDLNNRAAKVRSAFGAGETGVQHAHARAPGGLELVAPEALMLPDGLQQAFGRRIIFVAQDIRRAATQAPVGVKIFRRRRHCGLLLRLRSSKVKPARKILNAANGGFGRL